MQVLLTLQVSTHRLSVRKTVSSPPRLVFRTNIFLDKTESVSVSTLPYTLTWTDENLYFVKRDTKLNVIRIPLFRPAKAGTQSVVCYVRNDIHLPRTAARRDVHYYPPQKGVRREREGKGTIIIGSYSSLPAQGILLPQQAISPPIGVYVSEQDDLGEWICKADVTDTKQRHNNAGGRLQGKFEQFDLKEDCDIVPFMVSFVDIRESTSVSVSWTLYDPALTETEFESERRLYQADLTLFAKCDSFTCTIHTVVLILLTNRPLG